MSSVSSVQTGGYIYQTSWSGGVKRPPRVTSAMSVCFSGRTPKMERFTMVEGEEEGGRGIDPREGLK